MAMTEGAGRARRRRLMVIYNPAAGQRRHPLYAATVARLEAAGASLDIRATAGPGDAERLARAADPARHDAVVAAGGDGTINETINGMLGSALPLGFLSLGTANVFAGEIGLAVAPETMCRTLLEGGVRRVHVGLANGRAFGLMAGIGHDAHVVSKVRLGLKRRIGKGAYAWQAFVEILRHRPLLYDVTVDGARYRAASVVVAKGHFYGGRFVMAPDADIAAPSFEVCIAAHAGRLPALAYGAGLALNVLPRMPGFRIVRGTNVRVEGPAEEPVQGDGDLVTRLPVDIRVAPETVDLIVP